MDITKDIKYVGVDDRKIDLFEGQYIVPDGMAYNSYVILDEKIAVMDSVDAGFFDEWMGNIALALGDRKPDYLIVQHMEPDHSANVARFLEAFPEATVVASDKAFPMMKQFFGTDFEERRIAVKGGDALCLGTHTLTFLAAPMVHWPEVIMTYDATDKVLFSADAFGKFGVREIGGDWACEARRYYFGIVGKYGAQAKKVLDAAKTLDIAVICPLHGPVLTENLGYYLDLYETWATYGSETDGVAIFYTSVYGNTKKAVERLAEILREKGCRVAVNDLARSDMAECVEDAFRYSKIVFATTTYNGDIFPFMRNFLHELSERGFQNKTVGLIENGTWAPLAAKKMTGMLEGGKNLTFAGTVTIRSALHDETPLAALAEALC